MDYIKQTLNKVRMSSCATDQTYFQAVEEVLGDIQQVILANEKYQEQNILERIVIANRSFVFKVEWIDDSGHIQTNTGYRIQFSNALGPYKGGLRFHPSVDSGILKFLAFEQTLKNSLSGQKLGGAKGGSNFNPKGKSDAEIMRFCKAFMTGLYPYIGAGIDVPAGDIGVGEKEIGYMYHQYKKLGGKNECCITGKPIILGGCLLRKEATGYGLVYIVEEILKSVDDSINSKICCVSGAGNVAIHTIEKISEMGGIAVTCSNSKGMILDSLGICANTLKDIRENRAPLETYLDTHPTAIHVKIEDYPETGNPVWNTPCHVALPCATQNEVSKIDAQNLVKNDCFLIAEGANMPSTREAVEIFREHKIRVCPSKAGNVGGVAISGIEMEQNSTMRYYTREEVDGKLRSLMINLFSRIQKTNLEFDLDDDYIKATNITSFINVADAMISEGY